MFRFNLNNKIIKNNFNLIFRFNKSSVVNKNETNPFLDLPVTPFIQLVDTRQTKLLSFSFSLLFFLSLFLFLISFLLVRLQSGQCFK